MARNVEIKARARRLAEITAVAKTFSAGLPEIAEQTDVFFRTSKGRLKLRILSPTHGKLIYYDRPDQPGPKTSTYSISTTDEPLSLRTVLTEAYGEEIVVRKFRTLIILGRTRVHIDQVENLGDFVELEVVLADGESDVDGVAEAYAIMDKLGIEESDLVEGAYADLLRQQELVV